MPETYSITDLAQEFGVTTRAIRHYEDKGLLRPERRGRMRVYAPGDRVRLKLILRGKRLGLPLDEIREILGMYDGRRGEAKQLDYLCRKIRQGREVLRRQQEDIEITLEDMDRIEAQCKAQLRELDGD